MRSKVAFFQEIETVFYEVESLNNFDQEVGRMIMRSKVKIALLATFDLMNNLLAASTIMRLKVKKALVGNN
jgi:hypothetical protein